MSCSERDWKERAKSLSGWRRPKRAGAQRFSASDSLPSSGPTIAPSSSQVSCPIPSGDVVAAAQEETEHEVEVLEDLEDAAGAAALATHPFNLVASDELSAK